MKFVRHCLFVAALLISTGCGNAEVTGTTLSIATFTVQVGNEQFAIRVVDQGTFEQLSGRMESGTIGVIMGRVAVGDGGFNSPWSWHLVPSSIAVVDAAIELCDGTPSYLEAHRDEWIGTVRDYCPWGAKVVSVRS